MTELQPAASDLLLAGMKLLEQVSDTAGVPADLLPVAKAGDREVAGGSAANSDPGGTASLRRHTHNRVHCSHTLWTNKSNMCSS